MSSPLTGKITEAYVTSTFDPPRVCFVVQLAEPAPDGKSTVTCKHKLDEKSAAKNAAGFASLGLAWPAGLKSLNSVVGREVPVRSSDYQGKTYYFISTFTTEQRDADDAINALVNRLAGQAVAVDDSEIPF